MTKKKPIPKPPESSAPSAPAVAEHVKKELSVDLIDDPETAMRSDMTPESLQDLALSIKRVGLIQPITVYPKNGRYEVIAGHRRLAASKLAKIPMIDCIIRKVKGDELEMMKAHENLYREDVKPSDEARYFDTLVQKQKITPNQVAQMINKSPAYVTDRLAILSWPPILRQAMEAGQITFSVAREFSRFTEEKQLVNAVRYANRSGMTTDLAKRWVNEAKASENYQVGQYTPPSDASEGQNAVVYETQCVYCREGLRLIDAEVVYMHKHCLSQANTVEISNEMPEQPEA